MNELIGKKITSIDFDKKKFILNFGEEKVDLMELYKVKGRSLYLIEMMKNNIETDVFTDGIIHSIRRYEGDTALGKNNKIIKQKRLTLSISLKYKEEDKLPSETLCITFCA